MPARLSTDRNAVSFTTTHFSFFSVVKAIIKGALKTFEAIFTATVADSLKTTGAEQPNCAEEGNARSDGYAISSTTKTNTVFWCFGEEDGQRVLTVVNNRRYPLEIDRSKALTVRSTDPAKLDEAASLSRLIEGPLQNILAPADSITYNVTVGNGAVGKIQTLFDSAGDALYQLQVGVETALDFLTQEGVAKGSAQARGIEVEAKLIDQMLKDNHCLQAVEDVDIPHIVPECLDAAGAFEAIGITGAAISIVSDVTSIVNFFHSGFSAIWDSVTGHDEYNIAISRSSVLSKPLSMGTSEGWDGGTYFYQVWAKDDHTSKCSAYAEGAQVISYLNSHHCDEVSRELGTVTIDGREVEFARSRLFFGGNPPNVDPSDIPSYGYAAGYCQLVEKDGTGNIIDLATAGVRIPGGTSHPLYPDAFAEDGEDSGCSTIDAWYTTGPTPLNDPDIENFEKGAAHSI